MPRNDVIQQDQEDGDDETDDECVHPLIEGEGTLEIIESRSTYTFEHTSDV